MDYNKDKKGDSPEQQEKQHHHKDIEPERSPVKPQEKQKYKLKRAGPGQWGLSSLFHIGNHVMDFVAFCLADIEVVDAINGRA